MNDISPEEQEILDDAQDYPCAREMEAEFQSALQAENDDVFPQYRELLHASLSTKPDFNGGGPNGPKGMPKELIEICISYIDSTDHEEIAEINNASMWNWLNDEIYFEIDQVLDHCHFPNEVQGIILEFIDRNNHDDLVVANLHYLTSRKRKNTTNAEEDKGVENNLGPNKRQKIE